MDIGDRAVRSIQTFVTRIREALVDAGGTFRDSTVRLLRQPYEALSRIAPWPLKGRRERLQDYHVSFNLEAWNQGQDVRCNRRVEEPKRKQQTLKRIKDKAAKRKANAIAAQTLLTPIDDSKPKPPEKDDLLRRARMASLDSGNSTIISVV